MTIPAATRPATGVRERTPRILIVEDHELLAQILVHALQREGLYADGIETNSVEEVIETARRFEPTVVLLDADLGHPIGSGLPLIGPLTELGASIVILTGGTDRLVHAELVQAGAVGVVTKDQPFPVLLRALEDVTQQGSLLGSDERHSLIAELRMQRLEERTRLAPFERLTPRERQVLHGILDGLRAAEIADRSFVSVDTVRSQIRAILVKLGVSSQLAAAALARQAGWDAGHR